MKKFRIGSRESRLAVIQSEMVMDYIRNQCPKYEPELVTMKTTGDKILDRTLDKIGGKEVPEVQKVTPTLIIRESVAELKR